MNLVVCGEDCSTVLRVYSVIRVTLQVELQTLKTVFFGEGGAISFLNKFFKFTLDYFIIPILSTEDYKLFT